MRDVSLLLILGGLVAAAAHRPWLGLLGLLVLTFLHPQGYVEGWTSSFPIYKTLVIAVLAGTALTAWQRPEELALPPPDWRLGMLLLLWVYFWVTTVYGKAPWAVWYKFYDVTKVLVPVLLTPVLINTRRKLGFLLAAISLCLALVAVKGGYWTILNGFKDRVYGPPGSEYFDNNHFAVAAIMNIPLLYLWIQGSASRAMRSLLVLAIGLSTLGALSSWSRGALLALGVTLVMMLGLGRRRWIMFSLAALVLTFGFLSLPESWFDRMETIAGYEQDVSAQGRLAAWQLGIDYAVKRPFLGAGFRGWQYINVNDGRLDWHNAYVQMLAEHGFIAFGLWLLLILGTLFGLLRLSWTGSAGSAEGAWLVQSARMIAVALTAYCIGAVFLSLAYWDLLYFLVMAGLLAIRLSRSDPAPGWDAIRETGASAVSRIFTLAWQPCPEPTSCKTENAPADRKKAEGRHKALFSHE